MFIKSVGSVEIQTVREQQGLVFGVDAKSLVVFQYLLAPLNRIAAVVSDTGEKCRKCQLEISQEAVGRDRIGQSCTVKNAVFLYPGIQSVII